VLDAVRGAQAVRVAAAVGRCPVVGAADRAALAVRARRRHAHTVRAPQPARAPRTVPRVLPAQAVQQFLRERAQRDRRVVRGRARQTVVVGVGGVVTARGRRPATRVRPVVRPARRHHVRQHVRDRVPGRRRGTAGRPRHRDGDTAGQRRGAPPAAAHRHGGDAQLVLQQRQRHDADVVGDYGGLTVAPVIVVVLPHAIGHHHHHHHHLTIATATITTITTIVAK